MRAILLSLLIMGAPAMAKDGKAPTPRGNAQINEEEAFWQSEIGQDIDRLFQEFTSGKKTHEQAYDEFNAKWADKLNGNQVQRPPTQSPQAPYLPVR